MEKLKETQRLAEYLTEHLRVISKLDITDQQHIRLLAALHKSIVDMSIVLAKAVLDAQTDERRGK